MTDPRIVLFEEILAIWRDRRNYPSRMPTFAKIGAVLYLYELPPDAEPEETSARSVGPGAGHAGP